jgi:cytochrome c peroxidase
MNIQRILFLRYSSVACFLVAISLLSGCSKQDPVSPTSVITPNPVGGGTPKLASPIPKTPPQIVYPSDNNPLDLTAEIELGRHLFFDKQLSVDGKVSCAGCHQPKSGFSDVSTFSRGMQGQMGSRNAPGLTNIAYNTIFTWDGRFPSLEKHAPGPIFNSVEMGNNFSVTQRDTTPSDYNSGPGPNDTLFLFARLDGTANLRSVHKADPNSKRVDINNVNYYTLMMKAWGTNVFSMDMIAKSIAAYERTFISTGSAFDQYNSGNENAISDDAKQGFQIFIDPMKGNCVSCHSGYNFTDQQFHNNGINGADGFVGNTTDIGRSTITKNKADNYKFKTPTLRNVALTGPWMHDGRFENDNSGGSAELSLESLIQRNYNRKTGPITGQDPLVRPLGLTGQEVAYVAEFLMTLTDYQFAKPATFTSPWSN